MSIPTNLRVKLICGFRRDQEHSISAEEAHKAYYLFLNPEARSIFENGLAIVGADIREIVPDWHGTMGWNPSHQLDAYDWTEIRDRGYEGRMRETLQLARSVAQRATPDMLAQPLSSLPALPSATAKRLTGV